MVVTRLLFSYFFYFSGMQRPSYTGILIAFGWLTTTCMWGTTEACSCMPTHPQTRYCQADFGMYFTNQPINQSNTLYTRLGYMGFCKFRWYWTLEHNSLEVRGIGTMFGNFPFLTSACLKSCNLCAWEYKYVFQTGFLADKSVSTMGILRQSETRILDFTRREQCNGKDGFYGFHLLSTRIAPADLTDLPLGIKMSAPNLLVCGSGGVNGALQSNGCGKCNLRFGQSSTRPYFIGNIRAACRCMPSQLFKKRAAMQIY